MRGHLACQDVLELISQRGELVLASIPFPARALSEAGPWVGDRLFDGDYLVSRETICRSYLSTPGLTLALEWPRHKDFILAAFDGSASSGQGSLDVSDFIICLTGDLHVSYVEHEDSLWAADSIYDDIIARRVLSPALEDR